MTLRNDNALFLLLLIVYAIGQIIVLL